MSYLSFFFFFFSILTKSVDIVFQLPLYSLFVLNNTPGVFCYLWVIFEFQILFVQKYCIQFCFINNLQDLNILKFCKILLFFRNKTFLRITVFQWYLLKKKEEEKKYTFLLLQKGNNKHSRKYFQFYLPVWIFDRVYYYYFFFTYL